MLNPFFQNKGVAFFYFFLWSLVAGAHFFVLYLLQLWPVELSVADALVFNIIYSILGIQLWFVVRFVNIERSRNINIVLTHAGAAIVTVALWILTGESIIRILFVTVPVEQITSTRYWRILIGLFFYLLIIAVYYAVMYYNNFQLKIEKENELNNLVKEAEIKMLRSQINPHFIFNSLNSISYLTMTEPEKAQEMIIKLSNFLRYSLGQTDQTNTSLSNELSNIELYLDIEKVRFGDRLKFERNVENNCLERQLPGMILQPLFENAVKYSLYENIESSSIQFICENEKGFLKITIKNTFETAATKNKGEGIGIKNISDRLKILYGRGDLLFFKETGSEFMVTLYIPQN